MGNTGEKQAGSNLTRTMKNETDHPQGANGPRVNLVFLGESTARSHLHGSSIDLVGDLHQPPAFHILVYSFIFVGIRREGAVDDVWGFCRETNHLMSLIIHLGL